MATRLAFAIALTLFMAIEPIRAQREKPLHPDLQGTWIGATLTPLQRPAEFKDKAAFTPEEAAEYVRTFEDRVRSRLPTEADRLTQADLDATYVETEVIKLDGLRTSLIVDPLNGMLPPLLPAAQARIAARPKRLYEDPETFNLAERCLLGNFGLGGSAASPPMLPSAAAASYYEIVQTDNYVMISAEWMHDARVIRMNSAHLAPTIKKWLGDSIGRWEGSTLVVDTTNFRPDTHNVDSGERLHVVERFTKVDASTMTYRVTVDDPETWATSWTAEWPFRATDSKIFELACHEGNYAIENFLRGARAEEKRQQSPVR
jgi:hypothetical protein